MGSPCSCEHKGESHAVRMPAQTGRENVHTHATHFCFVMLTRFTVVAWPEVLIKGTRLVTRPKRLKSRHAGCALSGGGGSDKPPTSPCNTLVRGDSQLASISKQVTFATMRLRTPLRTAECAWPPPASAFPDAPPRVTFNPRDCSILSDARAAGAS